ncbi:MAG: PIG-L family deacetylase [Anaerolineales bacterium]|nr:PIG-L family deacetylase [Anaerolineales bacterium]
MNQTFTFLGVFAHPDDEGSAGGTLGQAAAAGHRVYVACATRGDGVDAKISDPALATRETLGEVRSQELACACAKLGAQPPIFLGYQDGEVDQAPLEDAARAVARLIRELRPAVVITHGPEGGYGHPDHIAVSAFTTRGFALAGDPALALDAPPYAPAKLYYTAMPRSYLERVPAFRDRRADIRGQALRFLGVPDEAITTAVPVADGQTRKLAALSCHRTQFEFDPQTGQPKLFTTSLPEPQRSQFFGHERFVLARGPVLSNGLESDLLAGLR